MNLTATPIGTAPTAEEALAAFTDHADPTGAVAFAYTPTAAPWLRHTDGGWHTHTGEPLPDTAFELRAFTETAELRWWRDPHSDTGTAVLRTETSAGPDQPFRLDKGERSLLLWGSVTATADGWANLADPRIGDVLWVPLPGAGIGAVVRLRLVEYAAADQHGNLAVTDQRFTRLTHNRSDEAGEQA